MKNIIRKKNSGVISLFIILCFLIIPSLTFAQKLTHIVKKGDTLWDICEQYYGDSSLWPKLWEMNPFITNPHLLKEGDVITLFEKEPVKEEVKKVEVPEQKPSAPVPVKQDVKKIEPIKGVDISSLTTVDAIGSLYKEDDFQALGKIFASNSSKLMFSKGETTYVIFDEGKDIKIGDRFFIGKSSALIKHPNTNKGFGYVFNVKGVLTVKERLGSAKRGDEYYEKKNVFQAVIDESYEPINVDDALMPYESVTSCILPISADQKINANILAAKNQQELIHTNSIVYVDLGSNNGLKTGNILNVIKQNIVQDPAPEEKFFTWRSKIILPDIFIGRIMIIECGPDISTAIVISALEPLSAGDYVKGLSWDKMPDDLSEMTTCIMQ